jgi:hypothetical protein
VARSGRRGIPDAAQDRRGGVQVLPRLVLLHVGANVAVQANLARARIAGLYAVGRKERLEIVRRLELVGMGHVAVVALCGRRWGNDAHDAAGARGEFHTDQVPSHLGLGQPEPPAALVEALDLGILPRRVPSGGGFGGLLKKQRVLRLQVSLHHTDEGCGRCNGVGHIGERDGGGVSECLDDVVGPSRVWWCRHAVCGEDTTRDTLTCGCQASIRGPCTHG